MRATTPRRKPPSSRRSRPPDPRLAAEVERLRAENDALRRASYDRAPPIATSDLSDSARSEPSARYDAELAAVRNTNEQLRASQRELEATVRELQRQQVAASPAPQRRPEPFGSPADARRSPEPGAWPPRSPASPWTPSQAPASPAWAEPAAPPASPVRSPRGASFDESRRRRGRDVYIPSTNRGDVDIPSTNRGAAAAGTWIFR